MQLLFFVSGSDGNKPTHLPVEEKAEQMNYDVPQDRIERPMRHQVRA